MRVLSRTFTEFFESEKVGGALLLVATLMSLAAANSALRLCLSWRRSAESRCQR